MTPLAKQVASETKVENISEGTGLAGTVRAKDVLAVNPVYGTDFEVKPITNMRKLIAKSMRASLQNSAQLTHHLGADARRLLKLRQKVKTAVDTGSPFNITLNDMICFVTIKVLKQFPQVNAHFLGDRIKVFNKVHFGLAVDTDRGLMVPVIKNADDLSIQGLSSQFKEIAAACRKGNVNPELLASEAGSFTVSNLGSYGVEMFTPVINLPQVAILGVNTIVPRPKDLGDGVYGFVPYLGLSLTYDHQALDGGEATRFLKQIAIEIETLDFEL
jgi:pyruvate dehydrogenase E2 component (dihydrolipoamide acetyltransferase)